MSGRSWTPEETCRFLGLTYKKRAAQIAKELGRTVPAIMGMRRKLRRLLTLGAQNKELPELLAVNESIVLNQDLVEIRRRARLAAVPVKPHLRRGRATGRPHLVREHVRLPVEEP